MHDNKVRLSADVLEKAEQIAAEWGLKNARAAVEAVFRTYCDDYLYGRASLPQSPQPMAARAASTAWPPRGGGQAVTAADMPHCEALDALDQLLAL